MTVTLWRAGAQIAATTSGGSGGYAFTNIPPGDYEVRFAGATNRLEAVPGRVAIRLVPGRYSATFVR